MIFHRVTTGAVLTAAALLIMGQPAKADLFNIGSTFTVSGTDVTDSTTSFSQSVTLQNGTTAVDNGALNLTISIVPDGSSEWLVFDYQTATAGTQLVSNTADNWTMNQTGLDAAVPTDFDGAYAAFLDSSGNAITPTSSVFGGYVVGANPVPGGTGTGLVNVGFDDDNPPGPYFELGAFIDPFDQIDGRGVPSASVEGWYQALRFSPQAVTTPEPGSLSLLVTGLAAGIAGVALRRRRASR